MEEKEEEIKKPENYEEGGLDKMKTFIVHNWVQFVCLFSVPIWVITAIVVTIHHMIKLEFWWLTISFIVSILSGGYLITAHTLTKRKQPNNGETGGCKSCGKNKTKN